MSSIQMSETRDFDRSFHVTENGYAPADVEARMAELVADRLAFDRRAQQLEAEIALLGAGPAELDAAGAAHTLLHQAYSDANMLTLAAHAEADRARAAAHAEVSAELAQLESEILDVHQTAVESGHRLIDLARVRAADRLRREEVTVERCTEYAEFLVDRARTQAAAAATRIMRELGEQRQALSGDLTGRQSAGTERRRQLARGSATLKAQAKQIEKDAVRDAEMLRTAAAAQSARLIEDADNAVGRLESEIEQALAELAEAMSVLGAELAKVRGAVKPATAKATRKAPAAKSPDAPKRRSTRSTVPEQPIAPAAVIVEPATVVAPVVPPADEPVRPLAPVAADARPAAAAARPAAAAARPIADPLPVAPAAGPVRPAGVGQQPVRVTPVPVTRSVPAAEFTPKPARPAQTGFVRLTPTPGVPARRVVPVSVPPAAVLVARRVKRAAAAGKLPTTPAPVLAPAPGGPSCLAGATASTAVTVLRASRPQS